MVGEFRKLQQAKNFTTFLTSILSLMMLLSLVSACQRSDNQSENKPKAANQIKPNSSTVSKTQASTPIVASTPKTITNLNIAASSNLKMVLPLLTSDFNKLHPDIKINMKFDSPVNLFDTISSKRQSFDVFLSSNQVFPKLIYEDGIRQNISAPKYGKPFTFTRGQLVLYSTKHELDATPTSTLDNFLLDNQNASVVIANPQVSSYGVAAENWLLNQNLSTKLEHNVVYKPSIDETFDTVVAGGADFGFVGLSQILTHQSDMKANTLGSSKAENYAILPKDSYPPVLQDGIILQKAEISQQFVDYLLTAKAQDVLTDAGYLPVCSGSKLLPGCK